jgi:hypothetical protein
LNALTNDELNYIINNDKYIKTDPTLIDQIRTITSDLEVLSLNYQQQQQQQQQQMNRTIKRPLALNQTLTQLPFTSASTCSSFQSTTAVKDVTNKPRNIRPSTIPREYLCVLQTNHFLLHDFYKSKWDSLISWPPLTNQQPKLSETVLNGFSTCIVDNNLYIMGGHLVLKDNNYLKLVDIVWKYDPDRNEWTKCQKMLHKRAFHLSLSLKSSSTLTTFKKCHTSPSSNSSKNFIFLFYGLCYCENSPKQQQQQQQRHSTKQQTNFDNNDSSAINTTFQVGNGPFPKLLQCTHIEFYDLDTDW